LIEHYDGTAWSIVNSPSVASVSNELYGVSCVNSSDCWAVGLTYSGGLKQTLIEHYDGTAWSIVTSPNGTARQRWYRQDCDRDWLNSQ
jgi:hypothetical protein